ncbi:MAG: hypothetical protein O7E54_06315 [Planctomycetota bacterium]|nr:hypothetical protein [Planctomycetota bacterium]
MRAWTALVFASMVFGQEEKKPEPGPIDTFLVPVEKLKITPKSGDARAALDVFLRAHELHRKGNRYAALFYYLEFQAIEGKKHLPERYRTMTNKRMAKLLKGVRRDYRDCCTFYRKDRARGVAALQRFAKRWSALPEGRAARVVWESDALLAAVEKARALDKAGQRPKAVAPLAYAIKTHAHARHRLDAKLLLIEIGGPDLREPHEKEPEKNEEEEEEETIIEESEPTPPKPK